MTDHTTDQLEHARGGDDGRDCADDLDYYASQPASEPASGGWVRTTVAIDYTNSRGAEADAIGKAALERGLEVDDVKLIEVAGVGVWVAYMSAAAADTARALARLIGAGTPVVLTAEPSDLRGFDVVIKLGREREIDGGGTDTTEPDAPELDDPKPHFHPAAVAKGTFPLHNGRRGSYYADGDVIRPSGEVERWIDDRGRMLPSERERDTTGRLEQLARGDAQGLDDVS